MTEQTDEEDLELTELTVADWAKRLQTTYPGLISLRRSMRINFDIPPGWRELVEDALDGIQSQCEEASEGERDEDHTPYVAYLDAHEGRLTLQLTHASLQMADVIQRTIKEAERSCERCGELSRERQAVEVETPESRYASRTDMHTQRVCDECAQALRPKADPNRSVQVMTGIPKSGDIRENRLLDEYREELVKRRTPVATIPDLEQLSSALDAEFPWFGDLTRRLMRQLVSRQAGNGWFKLPPLLLHGPPGCGKTSYLQRLAELSRTVWRLIPLAGEHSAMLLKGTSRGWSTARAGAALELIKEKAIANPLIILDELDKAGGSSRNGHVHDALIQLLEVQTAQRFFDSFLMGEANVSWVSWIATVNEYRHLPSPLLSRFELVKVGMPRQQDYPAIVEGTIKAYARECDIRDEMMPRIGPLQWQWLSQYFSSPRMARRATQALLGTMLCDPAVAGEPVH